jgi:tetratricopeptide (TPR) repeat protein
MQRIVSALCLTISLATFAASGIAGAEEPAQTLQSLVAEAAAAQSRGDFASAAAFYRQATEIDTSIAELWANRGLMDHEIGNSSDAIECFKTAIHLKPSLFVPQLFLGIEYLAAKNPVSALPFLERAEQMKPDDVQVALSLGGANEMLDHADRATEIYERATELAPRNGSAWLGLGTSYLKQVENDSRLMVSTFKSSPYYSLLAAETLAEQGKLIQAEGAYQVAVAYSSPAPCAHAEFGIDLLEQKKPTEARQQFEIEGRGPGKCPLTQLGIAVNDLADGHPGAALEKITAIAAADAAFVETNLARFKGAVSADQAQTLFDLAESQPTSINLSPSVASLVQEAFLSQEAANEPGFAEGELPDPEPTTLASNAEQLFQNGKFAACDRALKSSLRSLTTAQRQLLAVCSYFTGDFQGASLAARRLKASSSLLAQGLYWEIKADQKLAVIALNHAGDIDPNSSGMHVLIGDTFRQRRHWKEAEAEYREAIALEPNSRAARLSLAIVLFTESKIDESLQMDQELLAENPDDPEANLLAGEILVQRNQFEKAEPYLLKCKNLQAEFVPHLHVLLGQVYAETERPRQAIEEFKQGLADDEDGSVHFQIARLYQQIGDKADAKEAFEESKQLVDRWNDRATIILEQGNDDLSHQ